MFTGFTKETSDFLWELSFHNERPWFLEHKEQFERVLNTPFKELARDTAALLQARFPDMAVQCHISRIYRDARRLFGRGPYKDHLWFTLWDDAGGKDGPAFWFELGAATYVYGMGFFEAAPAEMELYRRSIDANPARFLRMAKAAERGGWMLMGQPYKRPKAVHDDPLLDAWYNLKYVGVQKNFNLGGAAYTAELPGIVADAFVELMPLYRFLVEIWMSCPEEEKAK